MIEPQERPIDEPHPKIAVQQDNAEFDLVERGTQRIDGLLGSLWIGNHLNLFAGVSRSNIEDRESMSANIPPQSGPRKLRPRPLRVPAATAHREMILP